MLKFFQKSLLGFLIVGMATSPDAYSRSEPILLEWKSTAEKVYVDHQERDILSFEGGILDDEKSLIQKYQSSFPGKIIAWYGIKDPVFAELRIWESALVDKSLLKTEIQPQILTRTAAKKPYSTISFYPFRINPVSQKVEKLISFSYQVIEAIDHSQNYRAKALDYADHSVLQNGDWIKIGVTQDGVHRLNFDQITNRNGSFAGRPVEEILLYGNGGYMLPQKNDDPRIDDLQENRIRLEDKNSNGLFDQGDYILFYSTGSHKWELGTGDKYFRTMNSYSDTAFYFLTHQQDANGLRISNTDPGGGSPIQVFDHYDNHIQHELDLVNLIGSGREWYGETFDFTLNRTYDFDLGQVDSESIIYIKVAYAAKSIAQSTQFNIYANGDLLGAELVPGISGTYGYRARSGFVERNRNPNILNNGKLSIKVNYDKLGNPGASGFLNYIRVQSVSRIEVKNNRLDFRVLESSLGGLFGYKVQNMNSNMQVWEISDPLNPIGITYSFNNGEADFQHGNASGEVPEFVVFDPITARSPATLKNLPNQDLHAINPTDMVIICPDEFKSEAQTLADFRFQNDGIQSTIVSPARIYNEFSSGAQDISAIRNFLKMLYDRDQNGVFKYVLLFGGCSYDYKDRVQNNTNFVPVYESYESLDDVSSYSSEDYFGFLEDGKGAWNENNAVIPMDVGVGRLPVKNKAEAQDVVAKLIHYSSSAETYGAWRTWLSFIADDGDSNTHQKDSDGIARQVEARNPEYNQNKVFLGSFDQLPSPAGAISPAAKDAVDRAVTEGSLILNYSGHGGPIGWTEEQILRTDQILNWDNMDKLSFFFTATCEFGRYDDPEEVSGGELSLLNSKGGAMGLMTTSRPVYSFSNFNLNSEFYEHAFIKENGDYLRLGEIIRRTKNGYGTRNTRNFALLGDPSMKLNYPQERIRITEINNTPVAQGADTLKALCLVSVKGQVIYADSTPITGFSGMVDGLFFDKSSNLQTLAANGTVFDYNMFRNLIFKGKATVSNGEFEFQFVVPKDIDYNLGTARISIYGSTDGMDASGSFEDFYVGGSCGNVAVDNEPPSIELYLDDTSFVNGSMVGNDPLLIAFLEDENGINITGTGIGRGLSSWTSALPGEKIPMNAYYQGYPNTYTEGSVEYQFRNFKAGNHTLTFKAWDTHNNSAEASINFIVAGDAALALSYLYNYPNPFFETTSFGFDHNRAGEDLEIWVEIMNSGGKIIQTRNLEVLESPSVVTGDTHPELVWNPNESNQGPLEGGLYFFRMKVRSKSDGAEFKDVKRMVYIK